VVTNQSDPEERWRIKCSQDKQQLRQLQPKTKEGQRRQATKCERSQGDDACAHQHRFEHEHRYTSTEEECSPQKESDEEDERGTL
jgi:hypothetical protein